MVSNISFLHLIFLIVVSFATIDSCFAATAGDLGQSKQQIFTLIQSGDYSGADLATNKLIADCANSPGVNEAVHQIALKYQEVKNYQKEIELSRLVIKNWPDSERTIWSQMDIVMSYVALNDEKAAQAEVKTLLSSYKDDPNLPLSLNIIGGWYRKASFNQTLKEHFGAECPPKIRLAILNSDVMTKIEAGDFDKAGKAVDAMIAEFPSNTDLPDMLLAIAQQFGWRHQPQLAGSVYQQIVQRFPDSPIAAKAQKSISKTGQVANILSQQIDSGDYGKVNSAVGELIATFGDEEDTPAAVYEIANRLEGAGQFALARQAYEQIVWRYPKEAWADMSRMGVQRTKVLAFDEIGDETIE
jgi:TolA-binding protein